MSSVEIPDSTHRPVHILETRNLFVILLNWPCLTRFLLDYTLDTPSLLLYNFTLKPVKFLFHSQAARRNVFLSDWNKSPRDLVTTYQDLFPTLWSIVAFNSPVTRYWHSSHWFLFQSLWSPVLCLGYTCHTVTVSYNGQLSLLYS